MKSWRSFLLALVLGAFVSSASPVLGTTVTNVLLTDDFESPPLNTEVWGIADWWLGSRTQLGNWPFFMTNEPGTSYITLPLDTYNPGNPGVTFLGTEIYSLNSYERKLGLTIEARVRVFSTEQSGLVCSFFNWGAHWVGSTRLDDEHDYEFMTRQAANSVLLTTFNDFNWSDPTFSDGVHHWNNLAYVSGMDRGDWNTIAIAWKTNRTEWIVNGSLAWSTTNALAKDEPMAVRANFWAPNSDWADAYEPALQPTADPAANQTFYYDIDYIRVTRVEPLLEAPTGLIAAVAVSKVTLNWTDQSSNETGFEVQRAAKPKSGTPSYTKIGSAAANATAFTNYPGKGTWLYRVRATNQTDVSEFSNTAEARVAR